MNAKVLRVLEYDKVIHMLEQKATSDPGRQLCRDLVPMTDLAQIEQAQTETADALTRIFQKGSLNFGSNKPLGMCLRSLEIGSTLSSEELLRIAGLLENTARVKNFGRSDKDEEQQDSLTEYFHCLEPLAPLSKEIRRCIIDVDEIADDASPALKKIRRSMVLTGEKIHNQLNSMVNGSVRNYLQDAVITTRDGRYCIPVKAEYKGQVPGMVHDQSSTGSTFFIEPAAVVSLNNQLRELEIEEQKEIAVILANLSAEAGAHTLEIAENQRIMTQLDFIFAKASLAMDQNASRPLFNDEHIVRIRQGRHPLLDRKKVIPIDVELGKNFDLLVITGPNTGGKTVCLKTVGLFTLMGQAGLHIPALDRSQLSVFTEVFADIGDEQSIEQSLSTFSGHMTNIVQIIKLANAGSLCLIDELGAGTDPVEGAALAIAILERLRDKHAKIASTTHYAELKEFALRTPGVENGSCEFDVATLKPTYRLLIGVPGKSNAFAISKRLGIDDEIISRASELVSNENRQFEDVVEKLEKRRQSLEKQLENANRLTAKANTEKQKAENEMQKAKQRAEREIEKARQEAQRIISRTRAQADAVAEELEKARKAKDMSVQARTQLKKNIDKMEAHADPVKARNTPDEEYKLPRPLKVGDTVLIYDIDKNATVLAPPNKDGVVLVQAGIIKTRVDIKNLRLLKSNNKPAKDRFSSTRNVPSRMDVRPETEVDVRGETAFDAINIVDKAIDNAVLSGVSKMTIIHGKGTGVLKREINKYLKTNKAVKSQRLGVFGEGEDGVTIIELK